MLLIVEPQFSGLIKFVKSIVLSGPAAAYLTEQVADSLCSIADNSFANRFVLE